MEKNNTCRKSPWRFVFLAMAVLSGLWLVFCQGIIWMGEILMAASIPVLQSEASGIGIIGGADGPTAVFVATGSGPNWDLPLIAAIFVIGIVGFLRLRRCKPKQ